MSDPPTDPRWARRLICSETGETAPLDAPAFLSSAGAPWLVEYDLSPGRGRRLRDALPGRPWSLWRYRELLPVADFDGRVDLGEGGTPLVQVRRAGPRGISLWLKEESGNPTGSFKDRGLSMAVNRARELGAPGVQLASAGNAAMALTTFAAAAGLPSRVALPADTPETIERRCREVGSEVHKFPGTLVEAGKRLAEMDGDFWTLSTLREPYRVEGKKTMGLELAEQWDWDLPEWIVYPTGGGTGIVGMHKAFGELERLGLIAGPKPRFVVVQMAGCAPLVRAFEQGKPRIDPWKNADTRVWGLRVPKLLGDRLVLTALRETDGRAVAVPEESVGEVTGRVAREEGLRLGPEGAACWSAVERLAGEGAFAEGDRVVIFQTGHPDNYL